MNINPSNTTSLYLQIADLIKDNILRGILREEEQAPSTNEMAKTFGINPATAAKGLNLLADEGILYKKRGIGMFVAPHSKEKIVQTRKSEFYKEYVEKLVAEAKALSISSEELIEMISRANNHK